MTKTLTQTLTRYPNPAAQVSDLLARELVPGDVVELHTGDRVPADLRVLSLNTATLRAEQASLTGEAVAVQKARCRNICLLRWSLPCVKPSISAACMLRPLLTVACSKAGRCQATLECNGSARLCGITAQQ